MSQTEVAVSVADAREPVIDRKAPPLYHDDRIAFAASWDLYQMLVEAIGDQPVRLAFDGERVELMSPGLHHERYKETIGTLVRALAAGLKVPLIGVGSTRWRRPAARRGLEADTSFYLTREKVEDARRLPEDEARWPIPDLAIEIDISPAKVDRPGIYRALGIPEIWRFDGETLRIDRLGSDGAYADAPESGFLGLRTVEAAHLLRTVAGEAEDDTDYARRVTEWAHRVLLPRRTGGG